MTGDAVVTRLLSEQTAEVAVTRRTACGGSCGNCEACKCDSEVRVTALNGIGAMPGQRVVVESRSADVFGAALLVYILPVVLLLAGYIAGVLIGADEGGCVLLAFISMASGTAITVLFQRRKKKQTLSYNIIKISE